MSSEAKSIAEQLICIVAHFVDCNKNVLINIFLLSAALFGLQ